MSVQLTSDSLLLSGETDDSSCSLWLQNYFSISISHYSHCLFLIKCICIINALSVVTKGTVLREDGVPVNTWNFSMQVTPYQYYSVRFFSLLFSLSFSFLSFSPILPFFLSPFFQHICGLRQRSFCLDKAKD